MPIDRSLSPCVLHTCVVLCCERVPVGVMLIGVCVSRVLCLRICVHSSVMLYVLRGITRS